MSRARRWIQRHTPLLSYLFIVVIVAGLFAVAYFNGGGW